MHPLKPKYLFNDVATSTGFSVPVVSSVVGFFYERLNKAMTTCEDITINAPGLGSFRMKKNATVKMREKLVISLESMEKLDQSKPKIRKLTEERRQRISELDRAILLFDNEQNKLDQIKQRRNQNSPTSVI